MDQDKTSGNGSAMEAFEQGLWQKPSQERFLADLPAGKVVPWTPPMLRRMGVTTSNLPTKLPNTRDS